MNDSWLGASSSSSFARAAGYIKRRTGLGGVLSVKIRCTSPLLRHMAPPVSAVDAAIACLTEYMGEARATRGGMAAANMPPGAWSLTLGTLSRVPVQPDVQHPDSETARQPRGRRRCHVCGNDLRRGARFELPAIL